MFEYFSWKKLALALVILTTLGFQGSNKIWGQEDIGDRCNLLSSKYGEVIKGYKECFGVELIDTFAPVKVDAFGITNLEDEWARLDPFLAQLGNDPKAVGYIVVYGGSRNKYGELQERPKTLKAYIKEKGYDSNRVIFVQGGFREKFEYEFWRSPSNKIYPPIMPTVDAEKVIFRGKMKALPTNLYN